MDLIVNFKATNEVKYENGIFTIKLNEDNFYSEKNTTKEEVEKHIEKFANKMLKNCENFDIYAFMNRIREVFFAHIKGEKDSLYCGKYNYFDGIIHFGTYSTLDHELEHLSKQKETKIDKKQAITKSGLSFCINDGDNIGTGLDEGDTEHLKEKYHGKKYFRAYCFEILIHKHVQNLMGYNNLEKASFNAEYIDVLLKLTDYLSTNEALLFLDCLDYINDLEIFSKTTNKKEYEWCKIYIKYIAYCLKKAYLNKASIEKLNTKERKKIVNPNLWLQPHYILMEDRNEYMFKELKLIEKKDWTEFAEKILGKKIKRN